MNEEEKKAVEYTENCLIKITMGIDCEFDVNILDALVNIIKKLQKENEEYSKQLDLDYVDKNYISKQKIKDELEELKGKLEDISKRREKSKTKEEKTVLWCLEIRTDERIKTLQELL